MSLIKNPNQNGHFGLTVLDDPTDKTRDFGISGQDVSIPFEMEGTITFFTPRVPTKWELEHCCTVELTDGTALWNPAEVQIASVICYPTDHSTETVSYRQICALLEQTLSPANDDGPESDLSALTPY